MISLTQQIHHYHFLILPVIAIVGVTAIGIIADRSITHRIRRFAQKTSWKGSDTLIKALSGAPSLLGLLLGFRTAVEWAPVTASQATLLNEVIVSATIAFVTWVTERSLSALLEAYNTHQKSLFATTTIFNNIIKITVYILGGLALLHSLGISIAPMITALGIGGLAVALALKDTLSNLFSGIQVIASQQLKMGDYIKLGSGEEGYIVDITWRNTTIRALSNSVIVVPNSTVASAVITNFGRTQKDLSFSVPITIDFSSDLNHVESVVKGVIAEMQTEFTKKMPTVDPVIRYTGFTDSGITFNANLKVSEFEFQFEVRHEFIKRLHKALGNEHIHIPFPTREIVQKTSLPTPSTDD